MITEKEDILKSRKWRYATKTFDSSRKVSDQDMKTLLEAIRLSASSYGLQPYHVFVITDQELKSKLRPISWNQSQLEDASHILVFANKPDFGTELVDEYIHNVSNTRSIDVDNLKQYSDFMKSKLMDLSPQDKLNWTARQAYIALGNALQAAAELEIDSTPMEGIEYEKYDEILGLRAKGLTTTVVLALGYRSEEDTTQHLAKVRKSKEELFTHI